MPAARAAVRLRDGVFRGYQRQRDAAMTAALAYFAETLAPLFGRLESLVERLPRFEGSSLLRTEFDLRRHCA
jgi:hypothetical protein